MHYEKTVKDGVSVATSSIEGKRGELHVMIRVEGGIPFADQLGKVCDALETLTAATGMSPVFKRYFLSDPANQAQLLPAGEPCAVSVIGQAPLDGSKIALWAVLERDADYRNLGDGLWGDTRGRLWLGDSKCETSDSRTMTIDYLASLSDRLENMGASLLDNCVRTWFMVRDVDVNYAGVVAGRNEEFSRRGLDRTTHFISSTGIGGVPVAAPAPVAFNALCDTRLKPGQMGFVYGASHLNPTIEYGVAFERGTTVDYSDRRHVYISGTASIDNHGDVVYPGDIRRQTLRMIENIRVLLAEAGCGDEDVAHLIVYLRDPADYAVVDEIFNEELPAAPRVILLAPVCRPGWLIETECMAVKKMTHAEYADF